MSASPRVGRNKPQHGYVLVIGAFTMILAGILWIARVPENRAIQLESVINGLHHSSDENALEGGNPLPAVRHPESAMTNVEAETSFGSSDEGLLTSPHLEVQSGRLSWEIQIEALLASQLSDPDKVVSLLAHCNSLPAEALPRLAEEATTRLRDPDYNSVALPILLNPSTHGSVERILFSDLLERPDSIALPALLSLARSNAHSFAQSARESLALLIGKDFGTDWKLWEEAVNSALSNPERR